jgi:transglutaminase-like putative cysteine protease
VKNDFLGDRIAEFLLLAATSISAAYNICLVFVWSINIAINMTSIIVVCCIFLIMTCFFKRAAKYMGAVGGFLLAAILLIAQIRHNTVISFISSLMVKDYVLRQSDSFIRIFLCMIGLFCCFLMFYASKSRLGILFAFITGVSLVFTLSALDFTYSFTSLLVFMGSCTVLFIRRTLLLSVGQSKGRKSLLNFTAVTAVVCAAALLLTQPGYAKINAGLGKLPELDFTSISDMLSSLFPSTSKTGFSDYNPQQKLGGAITYDDTLVLEVEADEPFYLRGRIYDTYTGRNWLTNTNTDLSDMYNDLAFKEALGYSFSYINSLKNHNLDWVLNNNFYSNSPLLKQHVMKVTVKSAQQKYVFLPANVYKGELLDSTPKIDFVHLYPDILASSHIDPDTVYSVRYYTPDIYSKAFKSAEKTSAEDYVSILNDSRIKYYTDNYIAYNNNIRKTYMGTEKITERTKTLAKEITRNCNNEFEKADAIKSWLQNNCTYTISPRQPSPGGDFVDFFLFSSKSGYCVHFATAMTMLLRASGVPARYVEGYAAPTATTKGKYEVTNRQAHAWVEYYSDMYGFITVDPTPSQSLPKINFQGDSASNGQSGYSVPIMPNMSSTTSLSDLPSAEDTAAAARAKAAEQARKTALIVTAILSVAALLLMIYGGKSAVRALWYSIISQQRRNEQAISLYNYFSNSLKHLGFYKPPSATPAEYAESIRGKMMFGVVTFDKVTEVYDAARFGSREISEDDIAAMHYFYHHFYNYCRCYTGTIVFLLKYPLL